MTADNLEPANIKDVRQATRGATPEDVAAGDLVVVEDDDPQASKPTMIRKKKHGYSGVIIGVLIVVLAAAGGYLAYEKFYNQQWKRRLSSSRPRLRACMTFRRPRPASPASGHSATALSRQNRATCLL